MDDNEVVKRQEEQEAWMGAVELAVAWDNGTLPKRIEKKLTKLNFPFIKYLKEFNEFEKQMGYKKLTKWHHQI